MSRIAFRTMHTPGIGPMVGFDTHRGGGKRHTAQALRMQGITAKTKPEEGVYHTGSARQAHECAMLLHGAQTEAQKADALKALLLNVKDLDDAANASVLLLAGMEDAEKKAGDAEKKVMELHEVATELKQKHAEVVEVAKILTDENHALQVMVQAVDAAGICLIPDPSDTLDAETMEESDRRAFTKMIQTGECPVCRDGVLRRYEIGNADGTPGYFDIICSHCQRSLTGGDSIQTFFGDLALDYCPECECGDRAGSPCMHCYGLGYILAGNPITPTDTWEDHADAWKERRHD